MTVCELALQKLAKFSHACKQPPGLLPHLAWLLSPVTAALQNVYAYEEVRAIESKALKAWRYKEA